MKIQNKDRLLASGYATMAVFNGYKQNSQPLLNLVSPKELRGTLLSRGHTTNSGFKRFNGLKKFPNRY